MKLSKNFKLLILIVLIILVGFYLWRINQVVVLETKTETIDPMVYELSEQAEIIPTADPKWNLYRNFKYGFQIQYPAEWKYIRIYKNSNEVSVGFSNKSMDANVGLRIYMGKNLNETLYVLEQEYKDRDQIIDYKKILIKNIVFYDIFEKGQNLESITHNYLIEVGKNCYYLSTGSVFSNNWIVDQMVNSLEIF